MIAPQIAGLVIISLVVTDLLVENLMTLGGCAAVFILLFVGVAVARRKVLRA